MPRAANVPANLAAFFVHTAIVKLLSKWPAKLSHMMLKYSGVSTAPTSTFWHQSAAVLSEGPFLLLEKCVVNHEATLLEGSEFQI